ncbi:MAG: GDSL-type esterase/lipase family protein, partial [Chroococcidiopsis sp.]
MKILFFSLGLNVLGLVLTTLFIARKGGISYLRLKFSKLQKQRDRLRLQVANPVYYLQRVSQFQLAPICNSDIVFLGDSITDECEWSELLENPHVKNRGISGDTTMGVLNRLEDIV